METVTIDQVMDWSPCEDYNREEIEYLFNGRESLSALQIIRLKIPAEDRLWAVLRNDFFDDKNLRLMACDFAFDVLPIFEKKYLEDKRPRLAIETARKFANGLATRDEMASAWASALDSALETKIKIVKKYLSKKNEKL